MELNMIKPPMNTQEWTDKESGHRVRTEMFWDVMNSDFKVRVQYDDEPHTKVHSMEELKRENPGWENLPGSRIMSWITRELLRKHVNKNVPDNGWIALAER